ncbi:hypothetical protein MTYP_00575 [Methylophilaceae bacterium]|nr:hypothetical protein MTYP_00575 [Methylophilaceae bacterium]
MHALLDWVLSGFRSQNCQKPDAVSKQAGSNGEVSSTGDNWHPTFPGIAEEDLQYIIGQVHEEGFHVEKLRLFTAGNATGESILALHRWAALSHLEVTINHELGICFFEQLRAS